MKIWTTAFFLTALISYSVQAHPDQPGVVAIARATELGVHRVERLVTLRKIDPMFVNQLYAMRAERTGDSATPYKVYAYAIPDAAGKSSTLTMTSDAQGKVLTNVQGPLAQPANAVAWPDKDAATLLEEGLHFVLEGWVTNPAVKPFFLGLTSITMAPGQDAQGKLIATFAVTSDDESKTLFIKLKTDGTFISFEIK